MKIKRVVYSEPKNKKSALNLAVWMLNQIGLFEQRKENLMKNKITAQAKIEKLNQTLQELTSQIENCDNTSLHWKEKLEELKTKFALTEAEILELKSSLLREQIALTEKQLGMIEQGTENI